MTNVVDNSRNFDSSNIIKPLAKLVVTTRTTDIHIHEKGEKQVFYRKRRSLAACVDFPEITDAKGKLIMEGGFEHLWKALLPEKTSSDSNIIRFEHSQIRVSSLVGVGGRSLFIRFQKTTPPKLTDVFYRNPETLALFNNPEGLILIAGPLGGGKTTLAMAVVRFWAEVLCRHIVTIEDPIEYLLDRLQSGRVTQLEVPFADTEECLASLRQASRKVLRADMQGRFIGECRNGIAMTEAIAAAAAAEPCLTTIQAGGLAHAIIRARLLAAEKWGPELARVALASCLQAVVYVSLAYDAEGYPIPVIMLLPINNPDIKRIIEEATNDQLPKKINAYMADGVNRDKAIIDSRRATANAIELSAERPDIELALRTNDSMVGR